MVQGPGQLLRLARILSARMREPRNDLALRARQAHRRQDDEQARMGTGLRYRSKSQMTIPDALRERAEALDQRLDGLMKPGDILEREP